MTAAGHQREMCFLGNLLVFPVKASIEVFKLVSEGGGAGWGWNTEWFEVCDGLYFLPHAPQVRGIEALLNSP